MEFFCKASLVSKDANFLTSLYLLWLFVHPLLYRNVDVVLCCWDVHICCAFETNNQLGGIELHPQASLWIRGWSPPAALIRMEIKVTVSGSLEGEVRETGGLTLKPRDPLFLYSESGSLFTGFALHF